MELSQYKKEALRSETPLLEVRGDVDMLMHAMEFAVAAGDLLDYVKKIVVYGKPCDYRKLSELAAVANADVTQLRHIGDCGEPCPEFVQSVPVNPRLFHAAIGLFGEAGETFAALLSEARTGRLNTDNVIEEAGDALWYLGVELDEIEKLTGVTPAAVARKNIRKLEIRFPEKFTLEASEARNYDAEAQAMRLVGD